VARNRKRAKDRRTRRPPQAGGSKSGGGSSVPGVLPGTPTVTRGPSRPGIEPEANGVPDPLQHATPDVELAESQLAMGRPAQPEPDDPADEAEFEAEVDESIEDGARRDAVAAEPAHVGHRAGMFERLIGFLQGCWRELQRVQWPDRPQVMQATGVVIGFVIVAAAFLGLADLVAGKLVTFILK
jgi:preprotein translocase subunit SecE